MMSLFRAGNVSTMVIIESTDQETPTTYDATSAEAVTTNTNTPTTYSDSTSTEGVTTNSNTPTTYTLLPEVVTSNIVPTAVGVLCFLLVLIGLLIGFFVIVLYLYSKKNSDKRYTHVQNVIVSVVHCLLLCSVYTEVSYYQDYLRYRGYVDVGSNQNYYKYAIIIIL